jgi:hypothetical protein
VSLEPCGKFLFLPLLQRARELRKAKWVGKDVACAAHLELPTPSFELRAGHPRQVPWGIGGKGCDNRSTAAPHEHRVPSPSLQGIGYPLILRGNNILLLRPQGARRQSHGSMLLDRREAPLRGSRAVDRGNRGSSRLNRTRRGCLRSYWRCKCGIDQCRTRDVVALPPRRASDRRRTTLGREDWRGVPSLDRQILTGIEVCNWRCLCLVFRHCLKRGLRRHTG